MGLIDFREGGRGGRFVASTENDSDKLVLDAVVKATIGLTGYAAEQSNSTMFYFNIVTPSIIALWATGFRWEEKALQKAVEYFVDQAKGQEA